MLLRPVYVSRPKFKGYRETLATTNRVVLAGEVNLKNEDKILKNNENTVRQKVKEIGGGTTRISLE